MYRCHHCEAKIVRQKGNAKKSEKKFRFSGDGNADRIQKKHICPMKNTLSFLLCLLLLTPVCMWSQNRYDIIISELIPDPTPVVGLPANEWIELKNNSTVPINLQGWRLLDASGQSGPLPAVTIQPDSFLIVCGSSALTAMSSFGNTVSVTSFPSLDNDGEWVAVKAPDGRIIHAVQYSITWYGNALKQEGGWSLEMTDTQNPCSGKSNWTASVHPAGGTPGHKNSTAASNADNQPPQLLRSYSIDSINVRLVMDEPVDSVVASVASQYTCSNGLTIIQARAVPPLFQEVQLTLNSPMQFNTVYTIRASGLPDCKGNRLTNGEVLAGRPVDPAPGQLVINEILFNPKPNGDDYVEIVNHSKGVTDLSRAFIANRNSNGAVSSVKAISSTPLYLFPGEYMALTETPDRLPLYYMVRYPDRVLGLASPPSFPDDEGWVLLLNGQGDIIDEVHYKDDWHFKLISNAEGVALERLITEGTSNDPGNWHSASSTAGYGTPGYTNSQSSKRDTSSGTMQISPLIFSPDNDGRDDIALIQYSMETPGFVANLVIFNMAGRPVRRLVRNALLGKSGSWTWDGLDDSGRPLPIGHYILMAEWFNLDGKKEQFKQAIVLARKLN
jgi:hypothetical protein